MLTLVTGANGHIGGAITRRLLGRGRAVRALVRPEAPLRAIEGCDVEVVRSDVRDPAAVARAVAGCGVVYHTAALYLNWHPDPGLIVETAVVGTRNVLSAAAEHGVERILFTSSAAAVGASRDPSSPLDEGHFTQSFITPYVRAKCESEAIAREAARERGLPVVIVNPTLVLGPGDHKPTPSGGLVLRYLRSGSPVYFRAGVNVVDVEDVAEGHLLAEGKGRVGERYILGGENLMVDDLFRLLAGIAGLPPPRWRVGRTAATLAGLLLEGWGRVTGRPPLFTARQGRAYVGRYAYYSSAKAARELGYSARPACEVLERTVRWFAERGLVRPDVRERVLQQVGARCA